MFADVRQFRLGRAGAAGVILWGLVFQTLWIAPEPASDTHQSSQFVTPFQQGAVLSRWDRGHEISPSQANRRDLFAVAVHGPSSAAAPAGPHLAVPWVPGQLRTAVDRCPARSPPLSI